MSSTKCVYLNCPNRSRDGISMFRFPVHDEARLELWIRNSGNTYLDSLTNEELRCRYICAAHFNETSIHIGSTRSRLLGPAVPLPFQGIDVLVGSSNQNYAELQLSPEVLKVKTPTKFYSKQTQAAMIESKSLHSSPSSLFNEPYMITTPTQRLSRKCLFDEPKRRLSRKCLFETKPDDTPKTRQLKTTALLLQKKKEAQRKLICRLQAKSKRSKIIKEEDFRSDVSKTLALMQLRKKNIKKKWTEEEKKLCMSLFYKSPTTYNFLRRQGVVLAAPSTIRLWLSKSSCLPGLCPDVFKKIQARFENASLKEKACVLSFDEMSIMSCLEYSKKFDCIEGFEDLGSNHRCNNIAKHALVFLVRGLYAKWKLPIAYVLSGSNVKAENLKTLLIGVINKLFDHGLLPKAVVCDQATTNQKVLKGLGVTCQSPFFYCNERKLFALFDVPHLIKNIRNNFLKNDYINNKEQMSFQDIVKTYEIDKSSNLSRSLTKITDRHINPNTFQKMTVRLATQLFSNSVAAAIKTTKGTGQLKSETAEATAKFVKIVNNMFDALNSNQQFDSNPYKHALSKKSTLAIKAIVEGKFFFENLHKISFKNDASGQRIKILTRPPCFDGVVQTCEAVLQIFHEECSDPYVSYLITRKLNQDVIENLFALFRQKGGSNRNPTAKLLRTIFRSNLVNSLIKLPTTKNSEEDVDQYIDIEAPTLQSPSDHTSNTISLVDRVTLAIAGSSSETRDIEVASSFNDGENNQVTLEECSVTYFAGYLAKACLSKNCCDICSLNLLQEIDLKDEKQMLILNKSYDCSKSIKLKMPSDNLLRLVHTALNCFNLHFNNIAHHNKIKSKLFNLILNCVRCKAPELLSFSCEDHLFYIIDHMLLVKIHFYCKDKKSNILSGKENSKLRILKNN